ncbi:MAG: ABC transporter permease subunit [Leptospirales bacterium]
MNIETGKKSFWRSLKVFTRYEVFDLLKSKRFLLIVIVYITLLAIFNLLYWALTEKNMEIRHDPFAGKGSLDTIYRENIVNVFGQTRGLLNHVFSIDAVTIIYTYLMLTFSPLFLLLYIFPSISDEVQNKTTKVLSLYTTRLSVYVSKFIAILITTLPLLLLGSVITFLLNTSRLLPVDADVQMNYFWKIQVFVTLYLTMFIAMCMMASAAGRTTYGSLGIGIVLLLFFSIIDNFYPYASPFAYKDLVFYPGEQIITYFPLVCAGFTGIFFFAGFLMYKFREFK